MKPARVVIGSRSSRLAMAQALYVRDTLKRAYPEVDFEVRAIKTTGDRVLDVALSKIGDKGLFTKEIEEALSRREIDLAVHSMKDLPTELTPGLKIAAVTKREDPRDALVSRSSITPLENAVGNSLTGFTLQTLPGRSRVGTSSLRRRAQLLQARKDLVVLDLRGNLDTRLNKLDRGLYDAIILACAGLRRLGLAAGLSAIPMEEMLPQAGQGALGIEVHEDNGRIRDMVQVLDDADCHLSVDAERALLSGLEGGCQVPIGVYAQVSGEGISIKAGVFSPDGNGAVRDEIAGRKKDAGDLGRQLAGKMIGNEVARRILQDIRKVPA